MERFVIWAISALFALPLFLLARLADLPEIPVLLITFAGAIGGAAVGTKVTQRR